LTEQKRKQKRSSNDAQLRQHKFDGPILQDKSLTNTYPTLIFVDTRWILSYKSNEYFGLKQSQDIDWTFHGLIGFMVLMTTTALIINVW